MHKIEIRFVVAGFIGWLVFVIFMRLLGPAVFTPRNPILMLFFVVALIVTPLSIFLIARLLNVPMREMIVPTVVITFTALMCDGVAVGFTNLYGTTDEQILASSAALLWGAGAGLIGTLWLANRDARAQQA